jgi:hypothetical protein
VARDRPCSRLPRDCTIVLSAVTETAPVPHSPGIKGELVLVVGLLPLSLERKLSLS